MKTAWKITYRFINRVIWSTQYKREILINEIKQTLEDTLREIAEKEEVEILNLDIYAYYVDITIECDPRKSLHKVIKSMKQGTAAALKEKHPELIKKMSAIWSGKYITSSEGHMTKSEIADFLGKEKTRKVNQK